MRRVALSALLAAGATLLASCDDPVRPRGGVVPAVAGPTLAVVPAAQGGSWSAPFNWPLVAAHMNVLPDGRVMAWVSNDGAYAQGAQEHHAHAWEPGTGVFTNVTGGMHNVFCAGHTFLPDGRLLVAGGHIADNMGMKETHIYNWSTNAWESAPSMRAGRWYPTTATLPNGNVAIVAGSDEASSGNPYPEVWNGTGWRLLAGAPLNMPYYPWLHPAPDGRVFVSGPDSYSRYLNPSGSGEWTSAGRTAGGYREWGGSVMYAPGKVLIVGGGDPPTNTAETIDLNTGGGWRPTGSMANRRRHMNSTVLPDGRVLVVGGTKGTGFNDESQPVLAAEVWNPATGAWTTWASMQVGRLYHSSAVLLPDARVLVAGGGRCGSCVTNHYDAELFSPPYLFAADGTPAARPTITAAPATVNHGQGFSVQTPTPTAISRVTWVRLPATTHSFNGNQWINELAFARTTGALNVTAPATAYLAPPGHYMLFVLDSAGVPSVAKVVRLAGTAALPAPPSAPAAPSNFAAAASDSQQVNLSWTDNSTSETGFRVERCTGDGCTSFAEIDTVGPNVTRYVNRGLVKSTTYAYRVRARNGTGYSEYTPPIAAATRSGGPDGAPLMSRLSGKCLEVRNNSQDLGAKVVVAASCADVGNQRFIMPAVAQMGPIKAYGYLCLDAAGGSNRDGDPIIVWECNWTWATNQRWTPSAAGEIKGGTGKCIEVSGTAAPGDTLYLAPCSGTARQKFDVPQPGVDAPPVAQFTVTCTGRSCDFNSSASSDDEGIASRAWEFGDGTSAGDLVSPLKTYAGPGTYRATLTVTDAGGQRSSQTKDVVVTTTTPTNQTPVANFSSACTNLTCPFTDASTDADGSIASRSWAFGDGGTSAEVNPTRTYAAAGTYMVTLTVTDDKGATSSTSKQVAASSAPPPPPPPLTSVPLSSRASGKCLGVQGAGTAGATPVVLGTCLNRTEQRWSMPAGAGAPGPITVYSPSTCLDAAGGSNRDGDQIIIWPCHGQGNQQWTLTAAGELKGPTGKCIAVNGAATVDGTGLALAACSGAATQKFDVGATAPPPGSTPPTAAFTPSCTGLSCSFADASTDADGTVAAWGWAFGDGATSTLRNPTRTYAAAGTYTVTLTVTDNAGATNATSKVLTVPALRQLLSEAANKCVEVENGAQANGTRVFIVPCSGAAKQQWATPAVGVSGNIRMFANMCFDASSARGSDGDKIILWVCNGGANQRWTLTSAGELKVGTNGKCVTLIGDAVADFTQMAIYTCRGSAAQRFAYKVP